MSTSSPTSTPDQHPPRAAPGRLPAAIGLVLLLCLPAVFIARISQVTNPHLLGPGDPIPALTAKDLASNEIYHVDFTTLPVALLLFSTECSHCQRELTRFDRLSKQFGDRILFLAVSVSSKTKTTELIRADHPEVRILLDDEKNVQQGLGVDVVPALFLVGTDGAIAYSGSGEKSFASREKLLSEFVNSIRSTRN